MAGKEADMTETETVSVGTGEERRSFYKEKRDAVSNDASRWPKPPVPYETADGEVLVIAAAAADRLREAEEAIVELKQGPIYRDPLVTAVSALSGLECAESRSPQCRSEARRLAEVVAKAARERRHAWWTASSGALGEGLAEAAQTEEDEGYEGVAWGNWVWDMEADEWVERSDDNEAVLEAAGKETT